MKTVKILHLLPNLLNLYGEYANLTVLKYYLECNGYQTEIVPWENGEFDITGYDLVYIGSGTEENMLLALERLLPYKEVLCEAINNNVRLLATGNSMILFGSLVKTKNAELTALNIFDYSARESDERYSGDVITKDSTGKLCVGYINTSFTICCTEADEYELLLHPFGENTPCFCGARKNNLFAVALTGPYLVKNPHILEGYLEAITGEKLIIPQDSNIKKAYEFTLHSLKEHLKKKG